MNLHDYLRDRLYTMAGLNRPVVDYTPDEINADIAEKHAELEDCVILAKNRLAFGSFRYGLAKKNCHDFYDYGKELIKRATKYQETGNLEFLIDSINFAALEFKHPHIPGAKFEPIDDGEHSERIDNGTNN